MCNPVTMDWSRIAAHALRALRGDRSQRAFARRLGYQGNVVANWESGRRAPTLGEFYAAAARTGVDVAAALARFQPGAAPDERVEGDLAAARWLDRLRAGTSVAELARRSALSRHALRRWLAGDTRPRLPDALCLVDTLTGRVSDLLAELVPIDAVPELAQEHARRRAARALAQAEPWTAAVLRVVETEAWCAEARPPGWIAERLGIPAETEARCLAMLLDAGVLRPTPEGPRAAAPLSVRTAGGPALGALKRHWALQAADRALAPRPGDLLSFNVCSLSHADAERLRELHRRYYAEVRALVAASAPAQTVVLVNVQLVEWGV